MSRGLVTSILRFAIFFRNNAVQDGTWIATDLEIYTICEPGMYLVAACLPTYRPLAKRAREISSTSLRSFVKTKSRSGKEGADEIPLSRRWVGAPRSNESKVLTPESKDSHGGSLSSKDDIRSSNPFEPGIFPIDFTKTEELSYRYVSQE